MGLYWQENSGKMPKISENVAGWIYMNDGLKTSIDEKIYAQSLIAEHKTNHILPLLLSVLTVGVWVVFWMISAMDNCDRRNKIRREYGIDEETNYASICFLVIIFMIAVIFLIAYLPK
jgi:hypothetical protein